MQYIRPNPIGAYPAPQSNPAPGLLPLTDEQAAVIIQHNGFVTITEEEDEHGAVSWVVVPNTEAWEAWKSSLPPEAPFPPTQEERLAALEG